MGLDWPIMSTVAEIKEAIERLSPKEREELETMLWPEWDRPGGDLPPDVREKLAEAEAGKFRPGSKERVNALASDLE